MEVVYAATRVRPAHRGGAVGRGLTASGRGRAKASGIHRDHIGRLERGYEGESRPPTVRKLAEALGVDPAELVK